LTIGSDVYSEDADAGEVKTIEKPIDEVHLMIILDVGKTARKKQLLRRAYR